MLHLILFLLIVINIICLFKVIRSLEKIHINKIIVNGINHRKAKKVVLPKKK